MPPHGGGMGISMQNFEKVDSIRKNISSVIVGKDEIIGLILTSVLAGGHILLEDVPGTGKTVLAKSLAGSIDGEFSRVQFTPDLLPSDVTGINFYNQKAGEFTLRKGPVFGNIILADEINRATPRTQSSLLECMEEHQVTIDGVTYRLTEPFVVIATQNPVETAGTFPLPEAQLDRFLMKLSMGLPDKEEEIKIMERFMGDIPGGSSAKQVSAVCTAEDIVGMQQEAAKVYVHKAVLEYIASIVQATRKNSEIKLGISPRGTLALLRAVKAHAYIDGREYAVPEDVKSLAVPVLAHRLVLMSSFAGDEGKKKLINDILSSTEIVTEDWSR